MYALGDKKSRLNVVLWTIYLIGGKVRQNLTWKAIISGKTHHLMKSNWNKNIHSVLQLTTASNHLEHFWLFILGAVLFVRNDSVCYCLDVKSSLAIFSFCLPVWNPWQHWCTRSASGRTSRPAAARWGWWRLCRTRGHGGSQPPKRRCLKKW